MSEPKTINGIEFTRIRNPVGKGFLYFAEAGPGGKILAWNSGDIDQGTMNALIQWDTTEYKDSKPNPPKKEFNMKNNGWR